MERENPYASPSSDTPPESALRPGFVEIRWARPTLATFSHFVMLWSLSIGVVVGVLSLVATLFGDDAEFRLMEWQLEGFWAGLAMLLSIPLFFLMLGFLVAIWSPVFRVLAVLTGGPKLRFRTSDTHALRFSELCLRSFILMAFICGLFFGILVLLIDVSLSGGEMSDSSLSVVPEVLTRIPGVAWEVFVLPTMLAVYAALIAVPAFVPFRYLSHRSRRAFLQASEIAPQRQA